MARERLGRADERLVARLGEDRLDAWLGVGAGAGVGVGVGLGLGLGVEAG